MGLTIQYTLKAKGGPARALRLVHALRQFAATLPFQELGEVVDLSGSDCDADRRAAADPHHWLLLQAGESILVPPAERTRHRPQMQESCRVAPLRVIGFSAWAGEGCEEANFGLCRFPATFTASDGRERPTGLAAWHWSSFCKTQYASDPRLGGVVHFLRCHLSVIAVLDEARRLGCLTEVDDDGGFWQERKVASLAEQVGRSNEWVAALTGSLNDAAGSGVTAPITEYPNFERLEHAGQQQSPEAKLLGRLIQQVTPTREGGA